MTAGVYRVTGRLDYRGHKPGEEFMATLAPNVERRALDRGAIVLLERVVPAVRAGSWRLPEGWLDEWVRPHHDHRSPAQAGFLVEGGR